MINRIRALWKKSRPEIIVSAESYRNTLKVEATHQMFIDRDYYEPMEALLRQAGQVIKFPDTELHLMSGDSVDLSLGPYDLDTAMLFKMRFGGNLLKGETIWREID